MSEATQFFLSESMKLARELPMSEARLYLRGFMELACDSPEADSVRKAAIRLDQSDRQLELLIIKSAAVDGKGVK